MIHVLPSGRFSFHEDDFSSAEFREDSQWYYRDSGLPWIPPNPFAFFPKLEEQEFLERKPLLVAVFYFRAGMTGKREETRLVGEDAEALRELLKMLQPTYQIGPDGFARRIR